MKKSILFFLTLILTASSFAQITQGINFQAIASDNSNNIVTEQNIGIRLSIIKESITGIVVYTETHQVTSDLNGVISLTIGQGNTSDDFNGIEWGSASHFLKTEMDIEGGSNYTNMGTIQFASVPYAEYAKTAGNVELSLSQVLNEGNDAGAVQIKNLADPTDAQDAVNKDYVDALLARIEALENGGGTTDPNTVTDSRDGTVYQTVTIGEQVWMAENLAYLPSVNLVADGSEDASGSYYYVNGYDGTDLTAAKTTANYTTHGVLYNWNAALTACPTGWHLPSDTEWTALTDYLGGTTVAGGKLKESGTVNWSSPNTAASNESGFTGLPGGHRDELGNFSGVVGSGKWWSSTSSFISTFALGYGLNYANGSVDRANSIKHDALSCRCLKD